MITVEVLEGDATQITCDALVTCINSGKLWFGGLDGAIQRVGRTAFHDIPAQLDLSDGQIVYAEPFNVATAFKAVVFIVDDLEQPIRVLVKRALAVAAANGARRVVMPALRTGVMLDVAPEGGMEEIVQAIVQGTKDFADDRADTDMVVTFCIYQSPPVAGFFMALVASVGLSYAKRGKPIKLPAIQFKAGGEARWQDLATKNDDPWGDAILGIAGRWAAAMEPQIAEGKAVKDIAWPTYLTIYDDGIGGAMYGFIVGALWECWRYGEDLRRWHNLETQIGSEGEQANEQGGTLNPAFLNINAPDEE